MDLQCKLCGTGVESIAHVLFYCDVAKEFWDTAGISLTYMNPNHPLAKQLEIGLIYCQSQGYQSRYRELYHGCYGACGRTEMQLFSQELETRWPDKFSLLWRKPNCGRN